MKLKVLKDNDLKKTIGIIRQYFSPKKECLMAFLLGSQTTGKTYKESDVDIAVFFTKEPSLEDSHQLWGELEDLLKKEVDFIILNSAPATIAWEALRGIPIIIRDRAFYTEYMLDISKEAEDFREFIFDLWHWRELVRSEREGKI